MSLKRDGSTFTGIGRGCSCASSHGFTTGTSNQCGTRLFTYPANKADAMGVIQYEKQFLAPYPPAGVEASNAGFLFAPRVIFRAARTCNKNQERHVATQVELLLAPSRKPFSRVYTRHLRHLTGEQDLTYPDEPRVHLFHPNQQNRSKSRLNFGVGDL